SGVYRIFNFSGLGVEDGVPRYLVGDRENPRMGRKRGEFARSKLQKIRELMMKKKAEVEEAQEQLQKVEEERATQE
ncbi:unnamed protein product, partial [Amoebophrya sp. A25]